MRLGRTFWILDHVGHVDPSRFEETLMYCITRLGIHFCVIDVLQYMTQRGSEKRWDVQDQLVAIVNTTISQHQCHGLLVSHPKALAGGQNRDDRIVQLGDQKGHTEVFQDISNALSIYRPRDIDRAECSDNEGLMYAACVSLKQRNAYGKEGLIEFRFDPIAERFLDTQQTGNPTWLP
jgi:hypothetical protein